MLKQLYCLLLKLVLPTIPGDTADDSAIWIHPIDPSQSIIIGDDKNGGMMVWDLTGAEIQYIDATKRLNNVDIR